MTYEDFSCQIGNVSRETFELLERYVELLAKWQRSTNLISVEDEEEVWARHVIDGAQLLKHIQDSSVKILDIGSGNGIPGLILSILGYGDITLCEKNYKKCAFLRAVKRDLLLSCKIHEGLVEDLDVHYDVITARGFSKVHKILDFSYKNAKPTTAFYLLKGENADAEIEEARKKYKMTIELKTSITNIQGSVVKITKVQPLQ